MKFYRPDTVLETFVINMTSKNAILRFHTYHTFDSAFVRASKSALLPLCLIVSHALCAQVVEFHDPLLEESIRHALNYPDAPVTVAQMESLTELRIAWRWRRWR